MIMVRWVLLDHKDLQSWSELKCFKCSPSIVVPLLFVIPEASEVYSHNSNV